jgi:hypothetical protein
MRLEAIIAAATRNVSSHMTREMRPLPLLTTFRPSNFGAHISTAIQMIFGGVAKGDPGMSPILS